MGFLVVIWRSKSFNSRTPKGCDLFFAKYAPYGDRFNSRTPKGCDTAQFAIIV